MSIIHLHDHLSSTCLSFICMSIYHLHVYHSSPYLSFSYRSTYHIHVYHSSAGASIIFMSIIDLHTHLSSSCLSFIYRSIYHLHLYHSSSCLSFMYMSIYLHVYHLHEHLLALWRGGGANSIGSFVVHRYDRNHDGVISPEEFIAGLKSLVSSLINHPNLANDGILVHSPSSVN